MNIQEFFIPLKLPGLNEIIATKALTRRVRTGSGRMMLISKYDEQKIKYQRSIMRYVKRAQLKKMGLVMVDILWIEPSKRRDPDNVSAGVKYILDALVSVGILKNDNWRHVKKISHNFKCDKKNFGIRVVLTEYSDQIDL